MQLTCPECGEQIKAENINIHDMVAVCSVCNTVFKFKFPENKPKRRKVQQPQQMTVEEGDDLQIAYRTNFRLDKDETFLSSLLASVFFTFFTLLTISESLSGDKAVLIPFIFGLLTVSLYYWLSLIVFNKTHIDMTDVSIRVSRQPLPTFLNQTREINLSGVVSIISEETTASKKEAYDTPRYNVWANLHDGSRKVIVSDVTEDYGVFIAQRLNDHLELDMDDTQLDVSRLEDRDDHTDETHNNIYESSIENQNHKSSP